MSSTSTSVSCATPSTAGSDAAIACFDVAAGFSPVALYEALCRDGRVKLERLLSPDGCAKAVARTNHVRARAGAALRIDDWSSTRHEIYGPGLYCSDAALERLDADPAAVGQCHESGLINQGSWIGQLLHRHRLTGVVCEYLRRPDFTFSGPLHRIAVALPGAAAGAQAWHQDREHASGVDRFLTLWLCLDLDGDDPPLVHFHKDRPTSQLPANDPRLGDSAANALRPAVRPGDAFLFDPDCLHGTWSGTAGSRVSLDIRMHAPPPGAGAPG